ncbi:MAG: SDR family oxidoreductase [Solirubrobacterales bacterium]|nr:SDR family oxidoreductase [Solirubrobacterales bacterium]
MKLGGRTVVITGAAGGIGRALARRCLAAGARVAVSDRHPDSLRELGEELGKGAVAAPADVTDEQQIRELVATVESQLGPVDVFCANAGVAIGGDPIDTPDQVWDQALSVNVRAHVLAARVLLPGWLERGDGYFVTVASAAGLLSQIGSAPYSVTKHAAVAFAAWLSITYGHRGVRVSCVCPMGVRTPMLEGAGEGALENLAAQVVREGGVIEPEDVAEVTVEGIEAERFLVLPHPEVLKFFQRKASDYERWLDGMRRLQDAAEQKTATPDGGTAH